MSCRGTHAGTNEREEDVVIDMTRVDLDTRRPRCRPAVGWTSLTESECELAVLVADGLTNRQAAERLFISRHTVDAHLRHIFLKLGINSRVRLARLVALHTVASEPST
jgi:DNA-binding CsgD family transcriptional regulator